MAHFCSLRVARVGVPLGGLPQWADLRWVVTLAEFPCLLACLLEPWLGGQTAQRLVSDFKALLKFTFWLTPGGP